jgi:WD40 repeat protein
MRLFGSLVRLCVVLLAATLAAQARDLGDMSSAEISALQQRLADGGCYQGTIDGKASPALQDAIKACPSQDPILRIETGMHVAGIGAMGVDRACRVAATASEDKTVRVWSLPDGRLLHTLRVPIGPGYGGKIYATDVSPDDRWIAAGGWDAQSVDEDYIYIFDASTGAVVARVGPFSTIITHLAFSPDGRWLAAIADGLKAIDTQTWRVVAQDQAYGDAGTAEFGPDGRLYAVAFDGKLRRYGPGSVFKKEREVPTRGGKKPSSVAVDPRNQLVAVGIYDNGPKIDFYDVATLSFRFSADVKGIDNGNLATVAWSTNGTHLVAGGEYGTQFQGQWKYPLLAFGRDGKRIGGSLPVGGDTIQGLRPCGDALAVATADPAFGLVDSNSRIELWKTSVAPVMTGKADPGAFTLAPDTKQVRFGLGKGADEPVSFDLAQGTIASAPSMPPGFIGPLVEGLPVDKWTDELHPTFAGRPIELVQYELSRSLAIRRDRAGFVLGTDLYVRAFDAHGSQRWEQPGPSGAWGVNFSANGRIVTVAYSDGTIRWHRWSDGEELLALFVNRKTKAWVAWTPTGYYMASPGGEDLIGWHVNRGWNQAADFFPASRFRARFNRPDIVRLVLETLDEDAAIRQANEAAGRKESARPLIEHLPPVVRISSPADAAHTKNGTVTLQYAARSPSGQPIERIDVLINGRPVKAIGLLIRTVPANTEITGSIDVTLTQRVAELGLIAWTGGLASEVATVNVTWDGAPEATRKLYALVVGISDYADSAMKLTYAAKDAHDFDRALKGQKGAYYVDVETHVLTDREVTRSSIINGLAWLKTVATNPNDVSVVFLAEHGLTDEKQVYWFLPSDVSGSEDVHTKGVSQDEVRLALRNLSGRVLWFLDTCHAGLATARRPVDMNVLINNVTSVENGGIVVFAASTGRQLSAESGAWGNGAFTKAVVEGIELGKADLMRDGFITTSGLDIFVERRVRTLTEDKQNPVMGRPPDMPDFTIAQVSK